MAKQIVADRFWSKVVPSSTGCWIWIGCRQPSGYGKFCLAKGRTVLVHRWAYEMLIGPIEHGKQIDHLCRVRQCVNPTHMEPVTPHINTLRGAKTSQTHCPQGHPYDDANTYRKAFDRHLTHRQCRTCAKLYQRRLRERRKVASTK